MMTSEEDNHLHVGFTPNHGRTAGTAAGRKLSISQDLNDQMSSFLTEASMSGNKFDIKSDLYNDEKEVNGRTPHVDAEEIASHHRSEDFPHVTYLVGNTGNKHHHHHKHKHDKKHKHRKPSTDEQEQVLDQPQNTQGYTNEGLDVSPVQADPKPTSPDDPDGGSSGKLSPKVLRFYVDNKEKRASQESLPGVGFYIGADSSTADLQNTAPNLDSNKKPAYVDKNKNRHNAKPGDALGSVRKLGSEIQLVSDRHESTDDDQSISAHRYEPIQGVRHRKLAKPSMVKDIKEEPGRKRRQYDHSTHEMFVELDELQLGEHNDYMWKERARWIKFEEDVEEDSNRWGKPHVASLSFHSLLELRKCLELGVILLDLEAHDLPSIANIVVEECVKSDLLDPMQKGKVLKALLLKHKHVGDKGYNVKKNLSYLDLHLSDQRTPEVSQLRRFSEGVILKSQNSASHPNFKKNLMNDADDTEMTPQDAKEAQKSNFLEEIEKLKEAKIFLDEKASPDAITTLTFKDPNENKHVTIDIDSPKQNGNGLPKKDNSDNVKKSESPSFKRTKSFEKHQEISSIFKRIPVGAEATSVLVGGLDCIEKPIMAFVRLAEGQLLGNVTEVPVPVRFLFILLGPATDPMLDYYEIGRSISTLMADSEFHDIAYHADERKDLMDAINQFLADSMVLPPGNLEKKTLLPIMDMARRKSLFRQQQLQAAKPPEKPDPSKEDDPLKRTKRLFGGMVKDVKRRYPQYLSDIKDAFNMQCLATFFFIYFACLTPAITFGGLMGEVTEKYMGVSEMLVMVCIGGIIMALLAGQPLVIVGATGPLLVFEESLYQICKTIDLEFLPFRFWVGIWVTIIAIFIVMFECIFVIRYITRFLQELFSALISLIFIYEVFKKLYLMFQAHPLVAYYPPPIFINGTDYDNNTSYVILDVDPNATFDPNSTYGMPTTPLPYDPTKNQPNTALLGLVLTFSTFLIAYALKIFRNGKYLGRQVRRAIGDFGIPIAIIVMVLIDYLIEDTFTEKLDVPNGFTPTAPYKRGWLVNPLGETKTLPVWAYFAALIPAILVSILIFMETLITSMIVNKPDRNLKKGSGYHLDIFLVGLFATVSGIIGLPLICVATVRSMTHVSALAVYSRTHAPGEKAKLIEVKEQRLTGLFVHIMIGVSVLLGPVLRLVPLAVLFGVFLYMGVASMSGVQLFERIELLFKPVKHHPDVGYVRKVRTLKMHLFTFIQVICLAILWAVKSTAAALSFPFFLILLIPVRLKLLTLMFTEKELAQLDCEGANDGDDSDDEDDFYETAMPV